jgi:hypothetical protein
MAIGYWQNPRYQRLQPRLQWVGVSALLVLAMVHMTIVLMRSHTVESFVGAGVFIAAPILMFIWAIRSKHELNMRVGVSGLVSVCALLYSYTVR